MYVMQPQQLITVHLQTETDNESVLTGASLQKKHVGNLFLEKPFYLKL